jgi:integrase/recombinase XerC
VDRPFFSELAAYLRLERPPALSTPECFVVLPRCDGRETAERSRDAQHLSLSPSHLGLFPGAAASAPSYFCNRTRQCWDEPAGALMALLGHVTPEMTTTGLDVARLAQAREYVSGRQPQGMSASSMN